MAGLNMASQGLRTASNLGWNPWGTGGTDYSTSMAFSNPYSSMASQSVSPFTMLNTVANYDTPSVGFMGAME
jgi:hypothetical protein